MYEIIQLNEATAADRRIYFSLVDESDGITPEDISVTGVKARLSFNGAAMAPSTNDIVKVTDSNNLPEYYIELTQAEANTALGTVRGYVKPTGCAKSPIQATIASFDPYAEGPTAATIADAVWDELRAAHVGAGSFGEGIASVQGNVTGSVASVTGNVGGNVVGSVGSVTGAVGSVTGAVGSVSGSVGSVAGNVGGNVVGSVGSVAVDGITASSLAADAINEIRDSIFARAFSAAYGNHTFDELVKLIAAVLLGKVSGLDTGTIIFRNLADSANVVNATGDASGNRTAVTRTP